MKKVSVLFFVIFLSFGLFSQGISETGILLYDNHKAGKKIRYNLNAIEGFSELVDSFIIKNKKVIINISYLNSCGIYQFIVGGVDLKTFDKLLVPFMKSTNRYYQPMGSKKRFPIILNFDNKFTSLSTWCCFAGNFWIKVDLINMKVISSDFFDFSTSK